MFNAIELIADEDEQARSPCKFGNIIVGHACYCHADHWKDGPRKCPVWRYFGIDESKWHKREWPYTEEVVSVGINDKGEYFETKEMCQMMPGDDRGGCPYFEPCD